EAEVDLRLTRRTDLVVGALDEQAGALQRERDVVPQGTEVVGRRDREVATLVADFVAAVAAVLDAAGVPGAGDRVDRVVAAVRLGLEPDVVEDVELGLRGEERGVRDPGR